MDRPCKVAKPARGQLNREIKRPCRCICGKYINMYWFCTAVCIVYIPGIFFIWGRVRSCTVHCCICIYV